MTMKNWDVKLPNWRLLAAWLALTFVAGVAYFLPAARLIEAAFAE